MKLLKSPCGGRSNVKIIYDEERNGWFLILGAVVYWFEDLQLGTYNRAAGMVGEPDKMKILKASWKDDTDTR